MRSDMKKKGMVLFLTGLLGMSLFLGGCTSKSEKKALEYKQLGISQMKEAKYEDAVSSFQKALDQSLGRIRAQELDVCYYKALGKLGTGKAMPLNITYAAWSLPFSYLLLHQVPGTKDILCALVVLLGALLAAYEKPQKLEKSNNQ